MPGYRGLICHLLKLLLVAGCWLLVVPGHGQICTIITTQPFDQTDCYGNTVEFSVEAGGTAGETTYQWQSRPPAGSFTDIPLETFPTLTIHDIGVNGLNIDSTEYRVLVTDDCGTITSEPALLSINAVTGLSGSVNLTICSGEGTTYSVSTHGSVVGYQWAFYDGTVWQPLSDGGAFSGTTSNQLTISDATIAETGSYRVSVTFNTLNQPPEYPTCVITTHTRNRNLTVLPAISPPVISADQAICYNSVPADLTATQASGGSGSVYSYQWQVSTDGISWTDISGAQALSFSPPALTATTLYRIAATDEGPLRCGTVYSYPVTITVNPLPLTSAIHHY